jgi:hypothetical protein
MQIKVPGFLSELESISSRAISFTENLNSSFHNLQELIVNQNIAPHLQSYFVKPALEVSCQYKIIKDLDFIDGKDVEAIEEEYTNLLEEDCNDIDKLILKADKDWMILLRGAEESLLSANPDRVRHTITSLRELVTQVIYRYAPDNKIRKNYSESEWYFQNKPTRRARLHYLLTRKHNNDLLVDFTDKDIDAVLALFDLYNKGTHEVISVLSPEQLRFIVLRTKILLGQLINF